MSATTLSRLSLSFLLILSIGVTYANVDPFKEAFEVPPPRHAGASGSPINSSDSIPNKGPGVNKGWTKIKERGVFVYLAFNDNKRLYKVSFPDDNITIPGHLEKLVSVHETETRDGKNALTFNTRNKSNNFEIRFEQELTSFETMIMKCRHKVNNFFFTLQQCEAEPVGNNQLINSMPLYFKDKSIKPEHAKSFKFLYNSTNDEILKDEQAAIAAIKDEALRSFRFIPKLRPARDATEHLNEGRLFVINDKSQDKIWPKVLIPKDYNVLVSHVTPEHSVIVYSKAKNLAKQLDKNDTVHGIIKSSTPIRSLDRKVNVSATTLDEQPNPDTEGSPALVTKLELNGQGNSKAYIYLVSDKSRGWKLSENNQKQRLIQPSNIDKKLTNRHKVLINKFLKFNSKS